MTAEPSVAPSPSSWLWFGRVLVAFARREIATASGYRVALVVRLLSFSISVLALAFFSRIEPAKVTAKIKDLTEMDAASATADDFIDLGENKAFEIVEMEGECAA